MPDHMRTACGLAQSSSAICNLITGSQLFQCLNWSIRTREEFRFVSPASVSMFLSGASPPARLLGASADPTEPVWFKWLSVQVALDPASDSLPLS